MRHQLFFKKVTAIVAAMAIAACRDGAVPQRTTESASTGRPHPPLHVIEAAGALASRQEAQEFFDRAREALVAGSSSSASTSLHEASGFFRERTELAKAGAQVGLERAAADLALLAVVLEGGDTVSLAQLDLTFARAQIAEAMNHCLLAKDAIQKSEPGRAGDELTMAIDHFERATRDARVEPDAWERASLRRARRAASGLFQGDATSPRTTKAIDTLGGVIMRMADRLDRQSR